MAMELERLEVVIDANLEKIEQQMQKIAPIVEKYLSMMGKKTTQTTDRMEKDLTLEKGMNRFEKQLEAMNKNFTRQMEFMEKQSVKSSEGVGKGLSTGISKGRKHVSKDIDAMVSEINAKMGQAKAKQEQIAFLKSKRQGAVSSNDNKGTIKYDNQIATAQAQLTTYHEKAKSLAQSMKKEFEDVPKALDTIASKMSQNEEQIESMRQKISRLQGEYSNAKTPKGNFTDGFSGTEENAASLKIQENIMKQTVKMNKLIQNSDALQQAYSLVEDRAKALEPSLAKINTTLASQSRQTETAGSGMRRFGRITEQSRGLFSRFKLGVGNFGNLASKGFGLASSSFTSFRNRFTRGSSQVTRETGRMSHGIGGMNRRMGQIVKQVLIYSLIYKGIRMMAQGLTSALKTNDQFNQSLNQIKVNLLTAFYPIYEYILPAINALMRTLSVATGYLASFIATLFGTTYSAAKQGASGLYSSIQAMNESGTAADKNKEKIKQMQRSLMGFDEINNLSTNTDEESSDAKTPGIDFSKASNAYGVPKWMTDMQSLLKDFFKPFQDAWNSQGSKVIGAWKYALREIIGLAQSIGSSFMEVWTNGTGQLFIENILKLLATVLNIIGDIAKAFKDAWNDEGRGTALIQSIFDWWNRILSLINRVGESFRNAWNDNGLGQSILGRLLSILTDIFNTIGNIAEGLEQAWVGGSTGESIFKTILTVVDDLLAALGRMTEKTAEWAKALDFTPLLSAIDKLFKAIEPLAKNVFDGVAWAYENILLPLAGFVIEDALPKFFEYFAAVLKVWNSVIEVLKPLYMWLWEDVLKPIASWSGEVFINAIDAIINVLTGLSDWINNHMDLIHQFIEIGTNIVSGLFEGILGDLVNVGTWLKENLVDPIVNGVKNLFGIHSPSTVFSEIGKFLIEGLYGGIKALVSKPLELIGALWSEMKTIVSTKTDEIFTKSNEVWRKTKETISNAATDSKKWVSDKWSDITKTTSNSWDSVKKWTSDTWSGASKTVSEKATEIASSASGRWKDITSDTAKTWDGFSNKVTEASKSAKDNASNRFLELRDNLKSRWSEAKGQTDSTWDSIYNKISAQATAAKNQGINAFSTMKSIMSDSLVGLKNTTQNTFDNIANWAIDLPNRIATGLKNGVNAIKTAASSIANGMVGIVGGAMNGVIKGINWVLDKVGAGNSKLGEWAIPKYAQGTGYHPGGLALVNDGVGQNYQEAYQTPDGRQGLFPRQRNLMVNLPKGSAVLNGQRTAKMMAGMPAYAGGVGTWLQEKWDGAKQVASDIWSYASNPSKLLNAAVSQFVNLKNTVQPSLDMAKGTVATTADGALDWVTNKFTEAYNTYKDSLTTSHDGSIDQTWGVYSYLKNIADKAIANFGGGLRITSGYRSGDPYYHGRRQAIDIALPPSMNGSTTNKSIANWAFDSFRNQVAYVITNGQVRDRSGLSGTGASGSWVRWPDNDHYDHVHINGLLDSSNISSLGSAGENIAGIRSYGGNVDRWQSTVANALRMLGSYSVANMNSTLNQIRTESSGNPNAINLWDVNARNGTPSKGLMQVIDPTFRAHARSPYNTNIWDPMSNILASMRYAIARYGSLTNAYRGVGYENGGWVTQEQYRIGEGNKAELVLPMTRPARALELISEALDYLGVDWFNSSITMPEAFQPTSFTKTSANFANSNPPRYEGTGMQQSLESMINGLLIAIQSIGGTPQTAPNGDIIINIGGKEFGRIVVSEINKYHASIGRTELNI